MRTPRRVLACLVFIWATLALFAGVSDAQIFRGVRSSGCNCPMCQSIRAGTWQGSYAATFSRPAQTVDQSPTTGPHAPTPIPVVDKMVQLAELTEDDLVYDPGCGDGRIIESAVRLTGCRAVGIEIDAGIAARARARLRTVLPSRWRVHTGDSSRLDLSEATVAIMYLYPDDLQEIVPRLTGCRRIISYRHPIPGFTNRTWQHAGGVIYIADRTEVTTDTWDSIQGSGKAGSDWDALSAAPCEQCVVQTVQLTPKPAPKPAPVRPRVTIPVAVTQPVQLCRGGT